MAETHQLKAYVAESLHQRLRLLAAQKNETISELVTAALEAYLKRREKRAA